MSLPAISVNGLGKMYRLSHQGKRTDSFREAITSALMSPLRRLRQIRGTDESMEEFWALKDVSFNAQRECLESPLPRTTTPSSHR